MDDSPYSWYVQAVDANQDTSAAPALSDARTFLLDTLNGTGSTPTLTGPANGSSSVRMPALSWTPVTGADTYVVHVAANGFELAPLGSGLHYPAYTSLAVPLAPDTYTWWVEARKDDVGTLSYSGTSTFTITRPDVLGSADYLGPAKCAQPGTCTPVADTPTLHWNPVPDAGYYLVSIANDPNFTNVLRVYGTAYTTLTPRESLVDNQAGQAYYWFVRPCVDAELNVCGPAPQDDTANNNASAFQKESNPIALTSPAVDATVSQQVTFSWDDFLDTNGSAAVTATQEARQYQVQVSTSADFATILDSATVDQTTYTASAKTYPEGPIYWRVQAIDESKNHLTWSPARRLVKQSPAVQPTSPGPGGHGQRRADLSVAAEPLRGDVRARGLQERRHHVLEREQGDHRVRPEVQRLHADRGPAQRRLRMAGAGGRRRHPGAALVGRAHVHPAGRRAAAAGARRRRDPRRRRGVQLGRRAGSRALHRRGQHVRLVRQHGGQPEHRDDRVGPDERAPRRHAVLAGPGARRGRARDRHLRRALVRARPERAAGDQPPAQSRRSTWPARSPPGSPSRSRT